MYGSIPAMNCLNCALAATCEPFSGQNFSVQEFNLPLGKPFSSKELPSKDFSSWRRTEPSFYNAPMPKKTMNMPSYKKAMPKFIALAKTEMCHFLDDYGNCPYGERCQYAHKESELKTVDRHPKYKTQVCKQFAQNGHCPYGRRCQFVHEQKQETKVTSQNNYKNNNNGGYNITLSFKPNQKANEVKQNTNAYNINKSEQKQVLYQNVANNVDGGISNVDVKGRLPVFVMLSQGIHPKSLNL